MKTLQFEIRQGQLNDLPELQLLFVDTITEVCKKDYNEQQIKAWTSGIQNKERWDDLIANQYLLVARHKDRIVGFCSLNKNYVDFLYVHKDYQDQGIAHQLYMGIESEAKRLGQTELTSDVSKTARSFFEKAGFAVLTEQTVVRQGTQLTNFKMIKDLMT